MPSTKGAAAAISLAFFAMMAGANLPTAFYDTYTMRFGLSPIGVSGMYSIYALTVIAGLPLFGRASDLIGRRAVLAAGMAMMAVASAAFVAAPSVASLYVGRVLQGISVGLVSGAGTAALAELLNDRARAAFMATAATASGSAVGPLAGGLLDKAVAWPPNTPFMLLAASSAGLAIALAVSVPRETNVRPAGGVDKSSALSVLGSAAFVESCAAGLFAFAIPGVFMSFGPGYVSTALGIHGPLVGGCLAFVLMGSSAVTQLVVRRSRFENPMCAGVMLLTAGFAMFAFGIQVQQLGLIAASAVVAGAGNGLAFTGAVASVNRIAPPGVRGLVSSVLYVAIYVGGGGGAFALGLAARSLGTPAALQASVVACTIVGTAIALPLVRRLSSVSTSGKVRL